MWTFVLRYGAAPSAQLGPTSSSLDTWTILTRHADYVSYERDFMPSTIEALDPDFTSNEIVVLASEFFDAWERGRWVIVPALTAPSLRGSKADGQAARHARGHLRGVQPKRLVD